MNIEEFTRQIAESAERYRKEGTTSAELYQVADEQRRTGFSITADYTSCIAGYVRHLENCIP